MPSGFRFSRFPAGRAKIRTSKVPFPERGLPKSKDVLDMCILLPVGHDVPTSTLNAKRRVGGREPAVEQAGRGGMCGSEA